MKILQVITSFPPAFAYGGPARVAYDISKELVNRGHEVTVYTTDLLDKNSRYKFETNPMYLDGIEVFHYRNVSNNLATNCGITCAPEMLLAFMKNLKKFDVVHCHENRAFEAVLLHHYAKKYKVPYILQAHGTALPLSNRQKLKSTFDFFYGSNLLNDASKLIALTKTEVEQYKEIGVTKEKTVIIPNGIDTDLFKDLPEKGTFRKQYEISEKYIILFLGRLHEIKGIDFLIKSYAELKKELNDVILVLAGPDNGYKTKAELLVSNLNLKDEVRFVGHVNGFNKLAAYVDADILVYPSIFEIFGLVPFEALICNTPVIVTDNCGCGELVKNANCGLLVKYGDTNDLKNKIKWLIKNPEEGEKLVKTGKKYIEENLMWNLIVDKVEKLYGECIFKNI